MVKRVLKRVVVSGSLLALALVLTVGGTFLWLRNSGKPRRAGEVRLAALSAPAEVRFDRWGVPHVEARSLADLAVVLGYVHANDRFLQMELGRRRAAGRLAEVFGPPAVGQDQYSRVLGLHRTAERNWGAAGPQARDLLLAYANGVNSWLADRSGDLPPEFRALRLTGGWEVEPWTPVDSLAFVSLMALELDLFRGVQEETRFHWLAAMGLERTRDLMGPPEAPVASDILELAAEMGPGRATPPAATEIAGVPGSNAWALGGSRTASGRPLVANDTHLALGLPGTWYQVMLRSPEYEVAGMTIPGLPVVVIGQNRELAWALTGSLLDTVDLYFEQLEEPENGETRVRRGDGWIPVRTELGSIDVRGGERITSRLRSTADRGPLLAPEEEAGVPARSLAWTVYHPGDSVGAVLKLGQARTLEEVPSAIAEYVGPAQNLIVAHRDGGMLYTVLGRVPQRRKGDGRLPEPGWRVEYVWDGLIPQASNPIVLNPPADLLISANDDRRPPDHRPTWHGDFDLPHRARRIGEILETRKDWSPEDLAAVQADVLSLYARQIVQLLEGRYRGDAAKAYAALEGWDHAMATRGGSALYALVEHELGREIFGDEAELYDLAPFDSRQRVLRALEGSMDPRWFDDVSTNGRETRHDILERALGQAWNSGSERWGSEVGDWSYGGIHQLALAHPFGRAPYVGRLLNRGWFAVGGSATTVNAFSGIWVQGFQPVRFGPSMRWVADTADADRSLAIVLGGQTSHPWDPHYDDQIEPFLRGEIHPVQWSEEAVERATVSRLYLRPGE